MPRYNNEPRLLVLKYPARCSETGEDLAVGTEVLYFPSSRSYFGLETEEVQLWKEREQDFYMTGSRY
jgi:hypothetical protein